MTHAHAPRRRAGQPAQGQPGHPHAEETCPSEIFPVAVPGRALPAHGAPVIRRKKFDAVRYNTQNGLGLGTVTREAVEEYVNDTDNDDDDRRGLLEAWNRNNSGRWLIETPPDLAGQNNPFHFSVFQQYQDFTKTSQGVSVDAFGGSVSAVYKRGAPKIGSNAKGWGKTKLGDSYVEYIRGLRSGGLTDPEIAEGLLELDESVFESDLERRAAAMMTVTVYLSEEWRKQGAAKIYRANLRMIRDGEKDFDDFLTSFKFIGSAVKGRRQVGQLYDVHNGDMDESDLDSDNQDILGAMSDIEDDDLSSDDDMRTDDKKNLKGKRLFAQKHTS